MKKILKGITWFMAGVFMVSGCALDSASWLPTIVCAISILWLAGAVWVSNLTEASEDEESEEC